MPIRPELPIEDRLAGLERQADLFDRGLEAAPKMMDQVRIEIARASKAEEELMMCIVALASMVLHPPKNPARALTKMIDLTLLKNPDATLMLIFKEVVTALTASDAGQTAERVLNLVWSNPESDEPPPAPKS